MATFQDIIGLGGILTGGILGASAANAQAKNTLLGGSIAAQGYNLTASGYRVSAQSVAAATQFNLELQKINSVRQLDSLGIQYQRTIGANMAATAASGISLSSKSALLVQNETANTFEKALLNMKLDAENTRRGMIFESQVTQTNLENQARSAEYQARASQALAASQARQQRSSGLGSLLTSGLSIAKRLPSVLG
jgi:hypothetical protein